MTEFEEGDECVGGVVHLGRTGTDILKTREEATQRGWSILGPDSPEPIMRSRLYPEKAKWERYARD